MKKRLVTLWLTIGEWMGMSHRHRRRTLRRAGLCVTCGGDLQGRKDFCPACGRRISKVPAGTMEWVAASFGKKVDRPKPKAKPTPDAKEADQSGKKG
jgi:hypothetical protein